MKMNRFLSILLILSMTLSLCVFVTADNPASLQLGDTTGDGKIDAGDALEVLQYSVGKRDSFSAETSDDVCETPPYKDFDSFTAFSDWITALEVRPEDKEFNVQEAFCYLHPEYYSGIIADNGYYIPSIDGMETTSVHVRLAEIIYGFEDEKGNVIACGYSPEKNRDIIVEDYMEEVTGDDGIVYYVDPDFSITWKQDDYVFWTMYGIMESDERTPASEYDLFGLVTWEFVSLSPAAE